MEFNKRKASYSTKQLNGSSEFACILYKFNALTEEQSNQNSKQPVPLRKPLTVSKSFRGTRGLREVTNLQIFQANRVSISNEDLNVLQLQKELKLKLVEQNRQQEYEVASNRKSVSLNSERFLSETKKGDEQVKQSSWAKFSQTVIGSSRKTISVASDKRRNSFLVELKNKLFDITSKEPDNQEKSLLWLPTDTYSSKSATSSPVQLRRQNTFLLPSSQSNPIRHTSLIELGEDSLNDSIKSSKQGSSGPLTIIKEGPIDRSKIVDSNRKPKKWVSNAYACLTTNSFYLFDKKQTFDALKSGVRDKRNYDIKIDLLSCELLTKSEFSSRKNIIAINDNKLKSQIILQFDKTEASDVWFNVLKANITRFQSSKRPQTLNSSLIPPPKIVLPANRAKEQKHIKQKLKKFFGGKRPAVGVLIKNGIYKNESVFGSDLEQLCENLPRPKVPYFVRACVEAIQPYLDTEGLYRASGNLSQIQKIRFEVDQHQYENVDGEKVDVHVLTGALKLFFRELKVSLIPAESYDQCVQQESTNSLRDILKTFPESHIDTLKFLLEHLLDVAKLERENRMDISNLATVWAPNLLQKVCKTNDTGSDQNMNLFFECSQQMKLIKFFLTNYREIFSDL